MGPNYEAPADGARGPIAPTGGLLVQKEIKTLATKKPPNGTAVSPSPVSEYIERLRSIRARIHAEGLAARQLVEEAEQTIDHCHKAEDDISMAIAALSKYA